MILSAGGSGSTGGRPTLPDEAYEPGSLSLSARRLRRVDVAADEPYIGFRLWRVVQDGVLLPEVRGTSPWPLEAAASRCGAGVFAGRDHVAPEVRCSCGWSARYDFEVLADLTDGPNAPDFPERFVAGAIAMWGRVVLEGHDSRAEYARPIALTPPRFVADIERRWVCAAAQRYQVPVVEREHLAAHASGQGREVPLELRPDPLLRAIPDREFLRLRGRGPHLLDERYQLVRGLAERYDIRVSASGLQLLANASALDPHGDALAACAMLANAAEDHLDLDVADIWSVVAGWEKFNEDRGLTAD